MTKPSRAYWSGSGTGATAAGNNEMRNTQMESSTVVPAGKCDANSVPTPTRDADMPHFDSSGPTVCEQLDILKWGHTQLKEQQEPYITCADGMQ